MNLISIIFNLINKETKNHQVIIINITHLEDQDIKFKKITQFVT